MRTAAEFETWLKTASPGEQITYYIGHLCYDRESIVTIGNRTVHMFNERVDNLGATAYDASERGKVMLFQRRLDAHSYEYIAVKRGKIDYRRYNL